MSRFETQKSFLEADRKTGRKLVGADVTMVIKGHEDLTFFVKTNGLPTLKNDEQVEYNTTHGVKTKQDGYLQTLNEVTVSFMENEPLYVKNKFEKLLLEDKNGEIEIDFFAGRTIESTNHWGTMKYCNLVLSEAPEGDSEGTTSTLAWSVTINGHYFPSGIGSSVANIKSAMNLLN